MTQLNFLENEYEYFILYVFEPAVVKNRYDKIFILDLIGVIQFYSGDADFPICALSLNVNEIKSVKIEPSRKTNVDLIQIERRDGKSIQLYGFKAA